MIGATVAKQGGDVPLPDPKAAAEPLVAAYRVRILEALAVASTQRVFRIFAWASFTVLRAIGPTVGLGAAFHFFPS
ncbi:hypothetical protein [Dyella ginsengisoli]|uniref:hypothetical protein n=1 Tax=Dyella ginsengisoli TaxID=363848 RepID=UPI00034BAFB8|nr:hypothetical protein [Dyella ginsengisoli]